MAYGIRCDLLAVKKTLKGQCEANLQTTADTDTAVEPKPFHERARDAREHLASGVTLQYTSSTDKYNIRN